MWCAYLLGSITLGIPLCVDDAWGEIGRDIAEMRATVHRRSAIDILEPAMTAALKRFKQIETRIESAQEWNRWCMSLAA